MEARRECGTHRNTVDPLRALSLTASLDLSSVLTDPGFR
jgi:hypothetical protein